eukprot:6178214-Pleurochrysis_carterae.AAC.1
MACLSTFAQRVRLQHSDRTLSRIYGKMSNGFRCEVVHSSTLLGILKWPAVYLFLCKLLAIATNAPPGILDQSLWRKVNMGQCLIDSDLEIVKLLQLLLISDSKMLQRSNRQRAYPSAEQRARTRAWGGEGGQVEGGSLSSTRCALRRLGPHDSILSLLVIRDINGYGIYV